MKFAHSNNLELAISFARMLKNSSLSCLAEKQEISISENPSQ